MAGAGGRRRGRRGYAVALAVVVAAGCAMAPAVPRVPAWSDPAAQTAPVDEEERALRADATRTLAELDAHGIFVADAKASAYLAGVLTRLLPAPLPANAPTPTVRIVRSVERQGSAFDNGVIVVSTSCLAVIENEAQLAALLGHELGHFLGRHGLITRRYARLTTSTVDRMRLARAQEEDADATGLGLMRRAGYDPHELLAVLTRLEPDDKASRGPVFAWESHPYVADRLRAMRGTVGEPSGTGVIAGREAYEDAMAGIFALAAQGELEARRLDRAKATIDRYLRVRPASGRGYFLLAEHTRLTDPEGRRSATARRAYERAVEIAPDDPDAVRALALLYRDDGDLARARPLLARYLRVAPRAADRKLIERYLADAPGGATP